MKILRLLFILACILALASSALAREISWFPRKRISEQYYNASFPTITSHGKYVHLAWQGETDENTCDIYYTRSADGGHKWEIIRSFSKSGKATEPQLFNEGETLYLFWYAETKQQKNLYYTTSRDNGLNWSALKKLTDRISYHYNSTIALKDKQIIVAWQENSSGVYQIHYQTSNDFGKRWSTKKQLTHSIRGATNPKLAYYYKTLIIVWSQKEPNGQTIHSATSTDWGENWQRPGPEILGTNFAYAPDIALTGQFAYLVWHDNRNGNLEIYGKILSPNKTSDIVQLSENFTPSTSAVVTISGQTIHVANQDIYDEKYTTFYRRSTFTRITQPQHVDSNSFPSYDNDQILDFIWNSTEECSSFKVIVSDNGTESFITNTPTASLSLTGENKHLYKIQVFGLDQEGNESLPSIPSASVYTDLHSPSARIVAPPDRIFMQDDLPPLIFKFSENETKIKKATLKVDEQVFPLEIEQGQKDLAHIPETNYPEGEHRFSLHLVDMANNQTTVSSRFTVDYTPPLLTVNPIYINEISDYLLIEGAFSDLGLDRIYSGDDEATINPQEKLFGLKALWDYNEMLVRIDAVDKAGNKSQLNVPVIYDTEKPIISYLTPLPGSVIKGKLVRIAAKVVDVGPAGLDRELMVMLLNNQDVTAETKWEGDYFVFYAPRSERRKNSVIIKAADKAGNEEEVYWIFSNARELQFEWIK